MQLIYGDRRELFAARGFSRENADPLFTCPISQDPLVSGIVASQQPRIIHDVQRMEDWKRLRGVRAWCGVPLVVGHKTVGLLTLDHEEPGVYSIETHSQILVEIASQAALAIRDAQQHRDLKLLHDFITELNTLQDPDEVYQTVVEAVVQTLHCDYCTVFLAESDGTLASHSYAGEMFEEPPRIRFHAGQGLAGWVYTQGESLLVSNTADDGRYVLGPTETEIEPRSILLAPLRQGDKIIGVISADFSRPNAFDENDRRLLDTLASDASTVLQNIAFTEDLRIVHDATQELARKTSLDEISAEAVKWTAKALHCSHSTFFMLDRRTGELVPQARKGSQSTHHQARHFRPGEGLAGTVLNMGKPLLVNDAAQDVRFLEGSFQSRSAPRSIVLTPVKTNGDTIGVLTADKDEINGFTDRTLEILETLGLGVGIAIRARKAQDRLRAIARFQQAISQVRGVREQLRQIDEQLSKTMVDTSGLYIALYDEDGDLLEFPAVYENGELIRDESQVGTSPYAPRKYGNPSGLTEWTIKRCRPLLVEDVGSWSEEWKDEITETMLEGLKCCLVVPMLVQDKVVGVIGLQNFDQPSVFTTDDRDFLAPIASHAAIAIENARLYDRTSGQLERQIRDLTAISQFQQEISEISSYEEEIEDIFTSAARALDGVVDTSYLTIATYDVSTGEIRFPLAYSAGRPVPAGDKEEGKPYGPRRFDQDRGLTRWVIHHRKPLLIPGDFDRWICEHRDEITLLETESAKCWLGVPMVAGDRVYGAIVLQHTLHEWMFDEKDEDLLTTIARQAAIVLDNARQYDELQAISKLQQKISEVESTEQQLWTIYEAAEEAMAGLMDTRNMYIALCHPERDLSIEFPFWYQEEWLGQSEERRPGTPYGPRRFGGRLLYRAGLELQPALNRGYLAGEERKAIESERHGALAQMRGDLERDLEALRRKLADTSEDNLTDPLRQVRRLALEGDLATLEEQSVKDALKAERNALREQLKGTPKAERPGTSKQALETALDLEQWIALEGGLKGLREAVAGIEGGIVRVETIQKGKHRLLVTNVSGEGDPMERVFPVLAEEEGLNIYYRLGLTDWVLYYRELLLIEEDFDATARRLGIQVFDIGTKCWLGAPLLLRDEVLGVIGLNNLDQEGVYDHHHKELLATIARQAAVAIENARLLEEDRRRAGEREKRLRQQQAISDLMAEVVFDPDSVLELVVQAANDVIRSDLTSVYLYDENTASFTGGVRLAGNGQVQEVAEEDFPEPGDFVTRVAEKQEACFEENAASVGFAKRYKIKAYGGLPLTVASPHGGYNTVGVLMVNFRQLHAFSEEEKDILRYLANQAAFAIAYTEARSSAEANEQLAALGTATATLQHRLGNTINITLPAVVRLRYRIGDDPVTEEILDTIERNTLFANEVIQRMQTPLRPEPFVQANINSLLREAVLQCVENTERFSLVRLSSSLSSTSTPNSKADGLPVIYVETALSEQRLETFASIGRLQEVFRVLVENAIKAIYPKPGLVTVYSHLRTGGRRQVIEITVSDTGKRIEEEVRVGFFGNRCLVGSLARELALVCGSATSL